MANQFDPHWFLRIQEVSKTALNLVCFPYGGGGAGAFVPLKQANLPVNIWALKLPGREKRIDEPRFTSASHLVDTLLEILPTQNPFIFYGHSMGAGIAFETILSLKQRGCSLPFALIASGREPPHFSYPNPIFNLTDAALVSYIQALGGFPGEMSNDSSFITPYLQKIRADYQLNDSLPIRIPQALPMEIHVINGENDPLINKYQISEWKLYSQFPISESWLPGDHFFIHKQFKEFTKFINTICWRYHEKNVLGGPLSN